jgi:Flp pilus assembly pilin Flp
MKQPTTLQTRNQDRQKGQGMVEYIIIVALIAIAAIGVYSYFGETVRHQVAGMASELSGTSASGEIAAAGKASGEGVKIADEAVTLGTYDKAGTSAIKK